MIRNNWSPRLLSIHGKSFACLLRLPSSCLGMRGACFEETGRNPSSPSLSLLHPVAVYDFFLKLRARVIADLSRLRRRLRSFAHMKSAEVGEISFRMRLTN